MSCGSAFSGVSGLVKRMTENDVLKMLKNFVTEKITLPGNSKIKILNLAPWVVSREGEVLNIFNTSSFGDFIDREGENSFYAYYVMGEGSEHFLISPYIGVTISCSKVNELLIPNTVYFSLQDKSFARMDIEHSEEQTKFTFKNSCVIVNNATAKVDPFALDKCKIDLGEIRNLVNSLKETTALPFLKYFY
ncbi:MAG: hypothetical protein LBD32_01920, partial [Cytophagales bacterium]|nr:hypothetical protein [Cytophagales bacterium]